jgi:ubiquinone/menaquinone biosynthesis C-methylase UbiE
VDLKIPPGKNFIQADAENLPFKDKEVDFLFCRHVFEHIEHPEIACKEIIRVAKRGYIQTPTRFWERMFTKPRGEHRWIVETEGEKLVFTPKTYDQVPGWTKFFDELFAYDKKFQVLFWNNYELFMNCYYWEDDFVWEVRK